MIKNKKQVKKKVKEREREKEWSNIGGRAKVIRLRLSVVAPNQINQD